MSESLMRLVNNTMSKKEAALDGAECEHDTCSYPFCSCPDRDIIEACGDDCTYPWCVCD